MVNVLPKPIIVILTWKRPTVTIIGVKGPGPIIAIMTIVRPRGIIAIVTIVGSRPVIAITSGGGGIMPVARLGAITGWGPIVGIVPFTPVVGIAPKRSGWTDFSDCRNLEGEGLTPSEEGVGSCRSCRLQRLRGRWGCNGRNDRVG